MLLDINFNFNNGDIYSDGGWLAAAIIAVSAVVLTILGQRIYDNYKNDERLDSLFDYLRLEAEKLGLNATKQAAGLIEVARVLKSKRTLDFDIPKVTAFSTEQTKEWEIADFYFSIILRRSAINLIKLIELYSKIKLAFNQARELERVILKSVDDLNDRLGRVQRHWQDHVQSIGTLYDLYAIDYARSRRVDDAFLRQYQNIIVEWKKLPETTKTEISVMYEHVVLPLKSLCQLYPLDDRAFHLLRELQELTKAHTNLAHIKDKYCRSFAKVARQLVKVKVDLTTGFDEAAKLKRKSKFHL